MLGHSEHEELVLGLVPVSANALKYCGAVVQSVGHYTYLGLRNRNYVSVEKGHFLRHDVTTP